MGIEIVEYQKGAAPDWAVWAAQKFGFVSSAAYHGEVLVRGRALRGDRDVRFGDGPDPAAELRLPLSSNVGVPGEEPGWRTWIELIRLNAPGCYVLQLDGLDFSSTVVFEAVEEAAASATPSVGAGR